MVRSRVRPVARPRTGETFIARVRIPEDDWIKLKKNAGERNRAVWIREHVNAVNRDAELWLMARRIAELRKESLWDVIHAALRRYVARNRHLLDEDE